MQEEKTPISPHTEIEIEMGILDETVKAPKSNGIGKLRVLYRSKDRIIALGPDYWFFIPAFSVFLIAAIFLFRTGQTCMDSLVFKLITSTIAILQPLSYLACALSNPGVVTHTTVSPEKANPQTANPTYGRSNVRYCKTCDIYVDRTTKHCQDCQLCIEQYDHHCPWVSKCIGKNNIRRFYLFVTITPIFIIYAIVTMCVCFAVEYENERLQHIGGK